MPSPQPWLRRKQERLYCVYTEEPRRKQEATIRWFGHSKRIREHTICTPCSSHLGLGPQRPASAGAEQHVGLVYTTPACMSGRIFVMIESPTARRLVECSD